MVGITKSAVDDSRIRTDNEQSNSTTMPAKKLWVSVTITQLYTRTQRLCDADSDQLA